MKGTKVISILLLVALMIAPMAAFASTVTSPGELTTVDNADKTGEPAPATVDPQNPASAGTEPNSGVAFVAARTFVPAQQTIVSAIGSQGVSYFGAGVLAGTGYPASALQINTIISVGGIGFQPKASIATYSLATSYPKGTPVFAAFGVIVGGSVSWVLVPAIVVEGGKVQVTYSAAQAVQLYAYMSNPCMLAILNVK